MNFEYFTKTIQQKGKRYFQDNRVFSITHDNHYMNPYRFAYIFF